MAFFSNFATLSYSGGTTNSNTVTGELLEAVSVTKTAVVENYAAGEDVTYVITMINSGDTAVSGLTLTDDLGGYTYAGGTVWPLSYVDGSARLYINGTLQASPGVTAGPPMIVTGISVPAGGNVTLVYEAAVTGFAPLAAGAEIVNTVSVAETVRLIDVTASETIAAEEAAELNISKAVSPTAVSPNGQLTYTFVIENVGNTAATAGDAAVLTDVFDPILEGLTVTYNGVTWAEGTNYTYEETSGTFTTLAGQITVPAAEYTQTADGQWSVTPGTATLVITGTVAASQTAG